ncbi:NADH-quinone oxidoreductase subunit J [Pantoea sp. 1.19]|uniref:NADH-quinone oxidoreductase subunit J n=1 Tax=Pantoea sp. 1.19 TaxID=1925589 RepID=UPI000948FD38|nr:NADH-quinone oxidoreductase subunit J [Pantoea sp. 1.19]
MELAFYLCGLIAVLTTLRVITHTSPVHALLYLIISLLAVAGVFFSLGAYFAGALEIIVYAGAIMVLFVFVVMMLNLGSTEHQERDWLKPSLWVGPGVLALALLAIVVHGILSVNDQGIDGTMIDAKAVGISLFGPYVLAVELASMLLLAGLVVAFHVGREDRIGEVISQREADAKRHQEDRV